MSNKFDTIFEKVMNRKSDIPINEGIKDNIILALKKMGITVTNKDLAASAIVIGGLLSAITSGEFTNAYLKTHPELLRPENTHLYQKIKAKIENQ